MRQSYFTLKIKEEDRIVQKPNIGRKYHVSWAKKGCVWRLIEINGDRAILKTPKSGKRIEVSVNDLREINKFAQFNAIRRVNLS